MKRCKPNTSSYNTRKLHISV